MLSRFIPPVLPATSSPSIRNKLKSFFVHLKNAEQFVPEKELTEAFRLEKVNSTSTDLVLTKRSMRNFKVITDIDDTVVASGGHRLLGIRLGGVDNRYKRGQFYPGVIQFALELSRPESENAPSKLAVLTARAKELKALLAIKPSGKLNKTYELTGKLQGHHNWGIGDVYYGSILEWVLHHRKGLRKFKNFELMLKEKGIDSYSQHADAEKYILIGDTGEKDEEACERIAKKYPTKVQAIFLHSVSRIQPRSPAAHSLPADRMVDTVPVYYFRTYVGAAVKAWQNGLLESSALIRVTQQAIADLELIDEPLPPTEMRRRLDRMLARSRQNSSAAALSALSRRWAARREEKRRPLQLLRWKELRDDLRLSPLLNSLFGDLVDEKLSRQSSSL